MKTETNFRFREGESLHWDELILYALLKVTGSPLYHSSFDGLTPENTAVLDWHSSLVTKTLNSITGKVFTKNELFYYICTMKNLTEVDNPTLIGFFDGRPRIEAFEPYVDLYLINCAWPLSNCLTGTIRQCLLLTNHAKELCTQISKGSVCVNQLPTEIFMFSKLCVNAKKFSAWRHDEKNGVLTLWKPLISRPYQTEKVLRVRENLTWEVEICGSVIEPSLSSWRAEEITSTEIFEGIVNELEKAIICRGVPKAEFPSLTKQLKDGVICNSKGDQVIGEENGDYIQNPQCLRIASSNQGPYRICDKCAKLTNSSLSEENDQKEEVEQPKSFQSEMLNTIVRLNKSLSEKKQQLVGLWDQYQAIHDKNRQLEKRVSELENKNSSEQPAIVVAEADWVEKQRAMREEICQLVKYKQMHGANKTPRLSQLTVTETVENQAAKRQKVSF